MICWMNGSYIEQAALKISPFDHGFLYGIGFFETFRTYDGQVLFLNDHMQRLTQALKAFRIELPYTQAEIKEVIQQLNTMNGGEDGYFRVNVSAGEHEIGLAPTAYPNPNVIIFRKALPKDNPLATKTATILQTLRNTSEVNGIRFKSHHYGNNVFARFELPSLATEEGIFLTEAGYVAEGITSNLFWVKNGKLYTPSIETNILAGITRKHVLQLAANLNIPIEQGLYEKEVLLRADEVFVTTSIQHIVPITKIERATYKGLNGFVTQKLQLAYEQMIKEEKVKEGDNDD